MSSSNDRMQLVLNVFVVIAQVRPTEWHPSAAEMKEAEKVEPAQEPQGIVQVLPYLLLLRGEPVHCW